MSKNLTIYSTPTCPKCKMIKAKLDAAGIRYNETQDIPTMQQLGITSVPVLKISEIGSESRLIRDFPEVVKAVTEIIEGV